MGAGFFVFTEMLGKTFKKVVQTDFENDDQLLFVTDTGEKFKFFHERDCCESVWIEDIVGDLTDLTNTPLLLAQEVWNDTNPTDEYFESTTWTMYTFATIKGSATVLWCGTSNGYYSEHVSVHREDANGKHLT